MIAGLVLLLLFICGCCFKALKLKGPGNKLTDTAKQECIMK